MRWPSLLIVLGLSWTFSVTAPVAADSAGTTDPKTIEWTDLMPEEDLALLESMPEVDHGEGDGSLEDPAGDNVRPEDRALSNDVENAISRAMQPNARGDSKSGERTWEDALVSTRTRPEFDGADIRLPGFIVPLEFDDAMNISEFFLVPYYGACIHVPPPPPNQIIFVRYPRGLQLENLYTPFWVTGTLRIETVENDTALASYAMNADAVVEYTE